MPIFSMMTAVILAAAADAGAPGGPEFPGAPATAVGKQLAWLFDGMNARQGKFSADELRAHFDPSFLAVAPPEKLAAVLAQVGASPLRLESITDASETKLAAHIVIGSHPLRVSMQIDPASTRIVGLLFTSEVRPGDEPKTLDEVKQAMAKAAPHAQLLAAELEGGVCKPIHAVNASEELAIGSTFKLYVLLGLADQIIAGKHQWEENLAVREEWKSLPTGTTQNDAAGTRLSLRTFAERMISISDNTAADHLLYTIGRAQAEEAVRESKHAAAARDVPFLSTRELFDFKLAMEPKEVDAWLMLAPEAKRAFLDETLAEKKPSLASAKLWKGARRIDKLEWFASASDLCNAMAALWTRAQNEKAAAPVLDVLAKNPGLPIDKKIWPYVGFKGGSEPGVINLTWLLKREDGRWFVVSLGLNSDEGGKADEGKAVAIATGVIDLIAVGRAAK